MLKIVVKHRSLKGKRAAPDMRRRAFIACRG